MRIYRDLAPWYPLMTPASDYANEADHLLRLIGRRHGRRHRWREKDMLIRLLAFGLAVATCSTAATAQMLYLQCGFVSVGCGPLTYRIDLQTTRIAHSCGGAPFFDTPDIKVRITADTIFADSANGPRFSANRVTGFGHAYDHGNISGMCHKVEGKVIDDNAPTGKVLRLRCLSAQESRRFTLKIDLQTGEYTSGWSFPGEFFTDESQKLRAQISADSIHDNKLWSVNRVTGEAYVSSPAIWRGRCERVT